MAVHAVPELGTVGRGAPFISSPTIFAGQTEEDQVVRRIRPRPTGQRRSGVHDIRANRIDKHRKTRNQVRQLEALGYTVTLTEAA